MKVNQFLPSIVLSNLHGINGIIPELSYHSLVRDVPYASRSLSPTEGRYAQIEKESLASTWACERFSDYLIGKTFHIETDHKPLASLLGNKNLSIFSSILHGINGIIPELSDHSLVRGGFPQVYYSTQENFP
jgi:hypothetical protein